jgi:hypothetical protein
MTIATSNTTVKRPRPPATARRTGYIVAAVVNIVLLFLVNVTPGWEAVPFLTEKMALVLGLVNLSMTAGVIVNILFALYDARWFKALGDILTTGVGLAALVRMLRVFPFDFGGSSVDWPLVARVLLLIGIVGSALAIVVHAGQFLRAALR